MSDLLVRVLAVWDVCGCRWAAVVRSDNHEHIDALHKQLVGLVMVFAVTFDCADDVEVVERALAALPKVHPEAVFKSYCDLVEHVVAANGQPIMPNDVSVH